MPAIIRINLETGSVSRREQEKDDLLLGGRRLWWDTGRNNF